MKKILLLLLATFAPLNSYATEFQAEIFGADDYKELKGFQIVEIGNTKTFGTAVNSTIYRLNDTCYVLDRFNPGFRANRASMILANEARDIKAAVFEHTYSGLKVTTESIQIVVCDLPETSALGSRCPVGLPMEQFLECRQAILNEMEQTVLDAQQRMQERELENQRLLLQLQELQLIDQ